MSLLICKKYICEIISLLLSKGKQVKQILFVLMLATGRNQLQEKDDNVTETWIFRFDFGLFFENIVGGPVTSGGADLPRTPP